MSGDDAIQTARLRRHELHRAMVDLETTLASPANSIGWVPALRHAVDALREALAGHNAATEASGGILDEMVEGAPRLDHRVAALQAEHPHLLAAADALAAAVRALGTGSSAADDVRLEALQLLGALARHRQRGADLVYDVFDVDIGGQA